MHLSDPTHSPAEQRTDNVDQQPRDLASFFFNDLLGAVLYDDLYGAQAEADIPSLAGFKLVQGHSYAPRFDAVNNAAIEYLRSQDSDRMRIVPILSFHLPVVQPHRARARVEKQFVQGLVSSISLYRRGRGMLDEVISRLPSISLTMGCRLWRIFRAGVGGSASATRLATCWQRRWLSISGSKTVLSRTCWLRKKWLQVMGHQLERCSWCSHICLSTTVVRVGDPTPSMTLQVMRIWECC